VTEHHPKRVIGLGSTAAPERRLLLLGSCGLGLAIVGAFGTWATTGPVSLSGVQGPNNGWLVVIFAAIGAAGLKAASRGSWLGVAAVLGGSAVVIWTALENAFQNADVLDADSGWGLWLTLAGAALAAAAAVLGGIEHARAGVDVQQRSRGWWKPALAVTGLLAAACLLVVCRQVLLIEQKPSWPPPSDAVASADAEASTEAFAAQSDPRPHDVGIDYAWSTAASIEPFVEGSTFYPRIFSDVERARSSVHVLMFGWREGEVGTELADLLVRKLGEGVDVRVLVDGFGSRPFGEAEAMYRRLTDAGAEVVVNDTLPIDRDGPVWDRAIDWRQDEVGRADHRKLIVIDGAIAWTGGAGIEDHFRDGRFHDVMVRVTGSVVRQAQAVFLTSFRGHGAPLPADLGRYFPTPPEGATAVTVVQTVPGGFQSAAQAIRAQIDQARRRLDIMNPYFTDKDMIDRILAAARRGVKVRIVLSEESNVAQAAAIAKHYYRRLLDAGVEIWEYPEAVVHAKVIVADDWVSFGTVNLDSWALYRNLEVAMIARSADAARLFEQRLFEPDIARSQPGKAPTGGGRAKAWLWDKLSYFL
jgi:phosphatidylserine/phosphatidylglycerophosphate/cardiolipin synthase-like enzyme